MNWWDDPKNQEEVKRISWWDHPENKRFFQFPISVITDDGKTWCVTSSKETEKLIGKVGGCSQGKSEEEAITKYFQLIKWHYDFLNEERMNYSRWVPLKIGPWESIGGKWFSVFGLHVSFRHGKGMKGGWYIPLTKLNISTYSEWTTYRKWIKDHQHEQ